MNGLIKMISILTLWAFVSSSCANSQNMINNSNVKVLDLDRYMGTWYEIARYPHSFEKGLVGVTATYSIKENGMIEVINQGYKNTLDGKLSKAVGKAKIPDMTDPGRLRVSFFWIFYADYLVMELDEDYEWVVIGSRSPNYLWILSRSPKMDIELYNSILKKIESRGYDTGKLIKVLQPELH